MPEDFIKKVLGLFEQLPYRERGILINSNLIIATIEILNSNKEKTLLQNARSEIMEKTPDGLDKLIKRKLKSNTRTANIISDILQEKGIVEVIKIKNKKTGRLIKATRLLNEWN